MAPVIGVVGIVAAGSAAWLAAVDWAHLPKLTANSPIGQLYDNGGEPAINEKH